MDIERSQPLKGNIGDEVPHESTNGHAQPAAGGRRAVIVGAGPTGAACAISLARLGFTVDIVERRPDPALNGPELRQTFIMGLGLRTVEPLLMLGVKTPEDDWIGEMAPSHGAILHKPNCKMTKRPIPKRSFNAERAAMAAHVVAEAQRLHPKQIKFHFNTCIQGIDLPARSVRVIAPDGAEQVIYYDLLVGADGSSSIVRGAVAEAVPGFTVSRKWSNQSYTVIRDLPPVDGIQPPSAGKEDPSEPNGGRYIHFYQRSVLDGHSRGFGAYMDRDGSSYSAALILVCRKTLPDDISTAEGFEAMLRREYKNLPEEWIPRIAKASTSTELHSWGSTIRCSQLVGPSVLLLGDAGHAVTPNLGQGCNSAMEDVGIFHTILQKHLEAGDAGIQSALEEYNSSRLKDAHALAYLDSISQDLSGNGPRGKLSIHFMVTLCHMAVGSALHAAVPSLFKPASFAAFRGSDVSYREIVSARWRDFAISVVAAGAIAGWAVKALLPQ